MDVETLVEHMGTVIVLMWADLLKVECDKEPWTDNEYPEKEAALRVALVGAIEKLVPVNEQAPTVQVTLPLGIQSRLKMLVRDELVNLLNYNGTSIDVMEMVCANFFSDGIPDDEYEEQVSSWCDVVYNMYRTKIEHLLREVH